MLQTRRRLLSAAGLGAVALSLPGAALARAPMGLPQAPSFYRFKIGTAEATIVSDGVLPLGDPSGAFLGFDKAEISERLANNFLSTENAVLEQNVLVLNTGEFVAVFDLGMGTSTAFGPTTGRLLGNLRLAGIDPVTVDALVVSHGHIDHIGAVMADDGRRNFPNAQIYMAQSDFDFWTDGANIPAGAPARAALLAQAQKNLLPNRDRMVFVRDGQEFLPGITAMSAPGHTVGHTIYMIQSGRQQLCYIGDLSHHQVLLMERPRAQFIFDSDPAQAAETRVRLLTSLAVNRVPILAYHFPWPGIGNVAVVGDGFRYYPSPLSLG
ncbi:MAG: MBL fold metallo-hydrolase [Gemmatimonadaceae bacterium]|nr:MBL fold metallo-hydrolase [Acetobacteraceae bacterium]